jgi:hypothetical protein
LRHDDVLLLRNGCVLMDQSVVYSSKYCPVTPLVPLPGVGLYLEDRSEGIMQ